MVNMSLLGVGLFLVIFLWGLSIQGIQKSLTPPPQLCPTLKNWLGSETASGPALLTTLGKSQP